MSWSDFVTIAPFVAVVLTAAAVIVVDIIVPGSRRMAIATALIGLAITAVVTALTGQSRATAFGGAYTVDALTTFLDLLFLAIAALTILFAPDYLEPRDLPMAEFAA